MPTNLLYRKGDFIVIANSRQWKGLLVGPISRAFVAFLYIAIAVASYVYCYGLSDDKNYKVTRLTV